MLTRHIIQFLASVIVLVSTASLFGQMQVDAQVDQLLAEGAKQRDRYIEVFQNLLAAETKKFETYGEDGKTKKPRIIRSNLIIYRLARANDRVVEFRNVLEVDGKPVDGDDKWAEEFFEKLAKSEDSVKELQRIEDESFRYDPDIRISGLTLFQGVTLAENIRPAIHFTIDGRDFIDGNEVIVLAFQQARPSEYIRVNRGPAPDPAKTAISYEIDGKANESLNERIRGKIWLDAKTFQIRRELREITVKPLDFPMAVLVSRTDAHYRSSEFGILTPKLIVHDLYRLKRKKKTSVKDITATFDYSAFAKPDVEVRSAEVK